MVSTTEATKIQTIYSLIYHQYNVALNYLLGEANFNIGLHHK